ncbi:hypothetical protein GIB67_033773 [Kingdonia uniflora]|uniref:RING-type E3 ubiquitin transferase n=1 Tax=Kingdonia uniflora TaxID=39325 RepID=A0A7J7P491_9MAGN|nr:hypothetical protein GIB67_033773 [Kingdonia uniflora]
MTTTIQDVRYPNFEVYAPDAKPNRTFEGVKVLIQFSINEKQLWVDSQTAITTGIRSRPIERSPVMFSIEFPYSLSSELLMPRIQESLSSGNSLQQSTIDYLTGSIADKACNMTKAMFEIGQKAIIVDAKVEVMTRLEYVEGEDIERAMRESFEANLDRNVPASKASVEALKTMIFEKEDTSKEPCGACLDEFLLGDKIVDMPCMHTFHESCIVRWLNEHNSCPLCRFKMPIN